MDAESLLITNFLRNISEIDAAFNNFAVQLRKRSDVKTATLCSFNPSFLNVHLYFEDGSLELYSGSEFGVSAILDNDSAIDWWVDLTWDEASWRVHCDVNKYYSDKDGYEVVISFPPWKAKNLDVFIENLKNSIDELIASAQDETLFN